MNGSDFCGKIVTGSETGGEERGSSSGTGGAMVGSVLTGGGDAKATDGAAMASINEGQIAMDSFMAGGEDSIERLGGASGVITSTSAGAGHGARIWVAMGVAGGKMTGSTTAAGAGGGGAATGSKAGAGTDEVGSTMSIMVGAATCSVGVLAGGGGAATVSVVDGAGGGATGSTREGRGGNGVIWSKMGGTGRMKGEGVMVGVIEGGEEGAGRTLGGALG